MNTYWTDILPTDVRWSDEKNRRLRQTRGVGFEDAVQAVQDGRVIATTRHPNAHEYPNQMITIVWIEDYAYVVPFVEDNGAIFLKTMYPSRKWKRRTKGDRNDRTK